MILENEFTVAAPADSVWAGLQDIGAVGDSLPASSLRALDGDDALQGTLAPRINGAELTCVATLKPLDVDEDSRSASYALRLRHRDGPALAHATIRARVHGSDGSTRVALSVDGRLASPDVSEDDARPEAERLLGELAASLEKNIAARAARPAVQARPEAAPPKPAAVGRPAEARHEPPPPPRDAAPSQPRLPVPAPVAAGAGAGALALAFALLAGRRRRRGAFVEIRYRW
jgi:carbon monoxide dehydrogenase subunit G